MEFENYHIVEIAAMEPSRMILMLVSGGIIFCAWLATLAIPLTSLFIINYHNGDNDDKWYMKILINVAPAASATSVFLIICSTSILAICNRVSFMRLVFSLQLFPYFFWAIRSIVTVLLMTKLALLFSGFSWASASLLLHYLKWDLDPEIFTLASISQGAGMLILAIIGTSLRVISICSGQDWPNQQQHNSQHQQLPAQEHPEKRRWVKVIRIFTLTLIACWILLSGLQVKSVFSE